MCPAPIRWLDPCGSGRFVVQHFNVADQVTDVFYTIEIRIRDFHGGEGLLHSAYLFKRQQVGVCHDAPPIGPNAPLRNQAIRSPVWRCFKIVRVLQERHCSPKKTRQKTLRHGLSPGAQVAVGAAGMMTTVAVGAVGTMMTGASFWYAGHFQNRRPRIAFSSGRFDGHLSARSRNGVHISDDGLATFIHVHMLDADGLRATVPQRRKASTWVA